MLVSRVVELPAAEIFIKIEIITVCFIHTHASACQSDDMESNYHITHQ